MNFWKICRLFLWKNTLHILKKLVQYLIIFGSCLAIFNFYLYITHKSITTPSFAPEIKDTNALRWFYPSNEGDFMMFAPSADMRINTTIDAVRTDLELSVSFVKPFENVSTMIYELEHNCPGNCFGIAFDEWPSDGENNERLRYSISSNKMRISSRKHYVNDEEITVMQDHDEYIRTGFVTLQHLIDKNYIKLLSNESNYELRMAAMPTRSLEVLDSEGVITFGLLYSVLFIVLLLGTFLIPLVEEKQNGFKEFLVITTPLSFLNGLTFFIIRFLLYMVFLIYTVVLTAIYPITEMVPISYMILLMVLFNLSIMSHTLLLSVFFNSVFSAKVGGFLMLTIPYIFRLEDNFFSSISTIFFSSKTFMDGIEVFQMFTNKHRSFNFGDLTTNITDWSHSILLIYMILIFQCVFYLLLFNYLSSVFPGPGGLKKPYLFFLKPSFYKKSQHNEYKTVEEGCDAVIIIQDLVKKFKTSKRIINIANALNMVIKNKQINVLLGHNGVGKTTLINMIMGSEPKDSGKIIVCNESDVASYRHLIGFCPQHNMFIDYMTCGQNLRFFAKLRGLNTEDTERSTKSLLQQLKLSDKENEYGWQLSGGMKRRLSLGIALAGNTKILILDEPSSGLDIQSRRELWDVLLELRKTKAVLVTTHHMDEAEVLGDTINILSNGKLKLQGSPLELKRKIGLGYILKICTIPERYREHETLSLIKRDIPDANVINGVSPTVNICLPYESKDKYKDMLSNLENSLNNLGIQSISVTDTSLWDVFLNCATEPYEEDDPLSESTPIRIPYEPITPSIKISFFQQFLAFFYKKLLFLRSKWIFTLLMVSLPFVATILAMCVVSSTATSKAEDPLPLNLHIVKQGRIYLRTTGEQTLFGSKVENTLRTEIQKHGFEVKDLKGEFGVSLEEEILEMQQKNMADFLQNVLGVIDLSKEGFDDLNVTVYFSLNIYHSSAVLTNLVDNAILKVKTSENENIETSYAPIRRFVTDVTPSRLDHYAVIMAMGMFFYMLYYIQLPFLEHESGFRSLQPVPVLRFWFFNFLFDSIQHAIICLLLCIFQISLRNEIFYNEEYLIGISLSMFLYGISYLPILYIFANSCRSISGISMYLFSMFIISAIIPLITSNSVQAMIFCETTIMFMRILPDFNLNHQFRVINENYLWNRNKSVNSRSNTSNTSKHLRETLNPYAMIWYAICVFIISGVILYIIEHKRICQKIRSFFSCRICRGVQQGNNEEEDSLVKKEKTKIDGIWESKSEKQYPLLVHRLFKFYGRKAYVQDLNFAVEQKECFGLLGVNGAGKTTTFKMITANTPISRGSIKIHGVDLNKNENQYRYQFGYCPQNECLNHFMTAYQSLKYMARLRNIEWKNIDEEVNFWLEKMDLVKYSNTQIRHYSGGTKRKLNVAMAMIGSPSLVLLDEPTTGVDPNSRKVVWECVQEFQKRGKTIVLTSHNMDECEQLCNRLAIMSEGRLKCMGSIPELKRKFGCGFTIKIKVKKTAYRTWDSISKIEKLFKQIFPSAQLRENHADMLTYFILCRGSISWSNVFKDMEYFLKNTQELTEDYSVNETTLEDIILSTNTKHLRGRSLSSPNIKGYISRSNDFPDWKNTKQPIEHFYVNETAMEGLIMKINTKNSRSRSRSRSLSSSNINISI